MISTSAATFDAITFNAKKLASLVPVSSELYEDEEVGLAAWFVEELAFAFASTYACGFVGDGSSTYGGIRGRTTLAIDGNHNASKYTASANTFGALTAADIAGLIGILPEYALPGASFYVSRPIPSTASLRAAAPSAA
jgi:HK97 family phage major capsid protein